MDTKGILVTNHIDGYTIYNGIGNIGREFGLCDDETMTEYFDFNLAVVQLEQKGN